jgi:hypothetical protein
MTFTLWLEVAVTWAVAALRRLARNRRSPFRQDRGGDLIESPPSMGYDNVHDRRPYEGDLT